MTTWYDTAAGRYRSTLVHKLAWIWLWPIIRWIMYRLPAETAHRWGIRGIYFVAFIDNIWIFFTSLLVLLVIAVLRLVAFLPGFKWSKEDAES